MDSLLRLILLASAVTFHLQTRSSEAIRLVIDDYYMRGNSKYFDNFTVTLTQNKAGEPTGSLRYILKKDVIKYYV